MYYISTTARDRVPTRHSAGTNAACIVYLRALRVVARVRRVLRVLRVLRVVPAHAAQRAQPGAAD